MSLRIAVGVITLRAVAVAAADGESPIPGIGAACLKVMQEGVDQGKIAAIWEKCSEESTAPCEFDAALEIAKRDTYDKYVQCIESSAKSGDAASPIPGISQACFDIVHNSTPEKESADIHETCQVKVPAVCQFNAWTDTATPETFEKFTKCQEGLGIGQAGGQASPITGVSRECFEIMRASVDKVKAGTIHDACQSQNVNKANCEFVAWLDAADDETRQSYEECLEGRAGKKDDHETRVAGVSEKCFGIIRGGVSKEKAESIHARCEARTPARCEFEAWFGAADDATKAAVAKCYEEAAAGGAAEASPIDGVSKKCFEQLRGSVDKEKAVDIHETCKQEVPAMCEFDALRSAVDAGIRERYEACLGEEAAERKSAMAAQGKFMSSSVRVRADPASAWSTQVLLILCAAGALAFLAFARPRACAWEVRRFTRPRSPELTQDEEEECERLVDAGL